MAGLRDTLAMLTALRRKLDQALGEASHQSPAANLVSAGRLREVADFGSNLGQLRMLLHVPTDLPARPALLVGLHGCTQSAASYDTGSGWSTLAGQAGFVALFPEQQQSNNPNRCFNWFADGDTRRVSGEVLSIRQMIDHAVSMHGIDRERIFVTGLSAGGAMASSLLAAYPELFAAGAIVAGLPHGSAGNLAEALDAMSKGRERTSRQWGHRTLLVIPSRPVAAAFSVAWQRDSIVRPTNAEASVLQWASVHGVPVVPSNDTTSGSHRVRTWLSESGEAVIEAHTIAGMGHGVPLASTATSAAARRDLSHFNVGVASPRRILSSWDCGGTRTGARPSLRRHDEEHWAAAHCRAQRRLGDAEGPGSSRFYERPCDENSTVTGRRQHPRSVTGGRRSSTQRFARSTVEVNVGRAFGSPRK